MARRRSPTKNPYVAEFPSSSPHRKRSQSRDLASQGDDVWLRINNPLYEPGKGLKPLALIFEVFMSIIDPTQPTDHMAKATLCVVAGDARAAHQAARGSA